MSLRSQRVIAMLVQGADGVLQSEPRMTHFMRRQRKVELVPSEREFVVHGKGITPAIISSALIAQQIHIIGVDDQTGVVVVDAPGGQGELKRALVAAGLDQRVTVDPSYNRPGASELDIWAPTRRMIVRFRVDTDQAAVDAIFAQHDLEILSKVHGMPRGYIVQVRSGNPVEIARLLVEENGASDAEPDFMRRFVARAPSP